MIGFEPFKGRTAVDGERVQVYRNLNRRDGVWWSIRGPEGLVRGHAKAVLLTDAYTYVNHVAQARIAAGAPREVHAWVNGTLTMSNVFDEGDHMRPVHYRPHQENVFRYADGELASEFRIALFHQTGMSACG